MKRAFGCLVGICGISVVAFGFWLLRELKRDHLAVFGVCPLDPDSFCIDDSDWTCGDMLKGRG